MPRLLRLLCLVNLVIGSAAFVVRGILVPPAQDPGIGAPAAGRAMTAYALSNVPGACRPASVRRVQVLPACRPCWRGATC